MKLLIVAATAQELTGLYDHFEIPKDSFVQTDHFDVLITGVGMTATAFALGKYLNSDYELLLNVGIAGSFDPSIPLGSLVQVTEDTFAELGAEDHDDFITIVDLGFGKNQYHATVEVEDLPKVKAITVNKVHGHASTIAKTHTLFPADIESMEGAAVLYACEAAQINCLQVRSISNYVTPRDKAQWQIGKAIKNLNNWLVQYVQQYLVNKKLPS
ncbi:MAG: futalosine hydrolase [Pedobacter sp.]|nr:futalosine hydrolase [Pedobacter sp.]MDQ8053189.1 futalosine hydrolase [Pedobacter sp.]